MAHESVVAKIAEYFYSGFLILVVKPALLQADDRDAVAAATVYLQVGRRTRGRYRALIFLLLTNSRGIIEDFNKF